MTAAMIHLRAWDSYSRSECGYWRDASQLTDDVALVRCGSCKKTRAYKKAAT